MLGRECIEQCDMMEWVVVSGTCGPQSARAVRETDTGKATAAMHAAACWGDGLLRKECGGS